MDRWAVTSWGVVKISCLALRLQRSARIRRGPDPTAVLIKLFMKTYAVLWHLGHVIQKSHAQPASRGPCDGKTLHTRGPNQPLRCLDFNNFEILEIFDNFGNFWTLLTIFTIIHFFKDGCHFWHSCFVTDHRGLAEEKKYWYALISSLSRSI